MKAKGEGSTANVCEELPVNSLVAGDFITVTVQGNYKFISLPIPTPTMTMKSAVTMVCEGAM